MITIQQDQLNQNIKRITTASVDDYANAIHSVANIIGTVVAFTLALVATAKAAYKHPLAALDQWTKPAPEAVAAPVKERPVTKPGSKPRPTQTRKSRAKRTKSLAPLGDVHLTLTSDTASTAQAA